MIKKLTRVGLYSEDKSLDLRKLAIKDGKLHVAIHQHARSERAIDRHRHLEPGKRALSRKRAGW